MADDEDLAPPDWDPSEQWEEASAEAEAVATGVPLAPPDLAPPPEPPPPDASAGMSSGEAMTEETMARARAAAAAGQDPAPIIAEARRRGVALPTTGLPSLPPARRSGGAWGPPPDF